MPIPVRSPGFVYSLGPFWLELWTLPGRATRIGTKRFAYRLFDDEWSPAPVFERWDWKGPEWETYPEVAFEIMRFMSQEWLDVKDPHWWFEWYTPEQELWREERAPFLKQLLEEEASGSGLARMHRLGGRKQKAL